MGSLSINGDAGLSRRLITAVVDQSAEEEPEATWIVAPGKNGYQHITYRQFANAINSTAWWLEQQLGKGDTTEPLAFFGTGGGDICYPIVLMGAVKAGYYVSFMLRGTPFREF